MWGMVIVALLAMSPVGELFVAYPVGIALGLDPLASLIIAVSFNALPIPLVLVLMDRAGGRLRGVFDWFRRRGGVYERYRGLGVLVFFLLTPVVGVYGTTVFMRLLGYGRLTCILTQLISLVVYGVLLYLGYLGFNYLRGYFL